MNPDAFCIPSESDSRVRGPTYHTLIKLFWGGEGMAGYDHCDKRFLTQRELFRLQGVPDGRIRRPIGVTDRQLGMMAGNSFCVTVFAALFDKVLGSVGLV